MFQEFFIQYFPLICGFLGLFFGSFANVIVYRIHKKKSFLWGRSKCPKCDKFLGMGELVPVLSWVFLGGKCKKCKTFISLQYPLVEIVFAFFWFFIAYQLGFPEGINEWNYFIFILYILSSLIVISVYDLLYLEIPDEVSIPVASLSFFALLLPNTSTLIDALWGIFIVYSFFYLQIFIPAFLHYLQIKKFKILKETIISYVLFPLWMFLSMFLPKIIIEKYFPIFDETEEDGEEEIPSWIGGGDLRLAFLIGLLFGIKGSLVTLFLAYMIGAIIGVFILLFRKTKNSVVPFGPFLCIGIFITLFWGEQIWNWYLQFLGM